MSSQNGAIRLFGVAAVGMEAFVKLLAANDEKWRSPFVFTRMLARGVP
jgi:hypothetical protein